MSNPTSLRAEPPQDRSVAPSYTWPNRVVNSQGWADFDISAYFEIVGVGIKVSGGNRVTTIDNVPQPDGEWYLRVYNWEDRPVNFDVTAWHS